MSLAQLWKDLPDTEKEYYQEMAKAFQQGVDGHCTSRRKRSTKKRIRKIKECIGRSNPHTIRVYIIFFFTTNLLIFYMVEAICRAISPRQYHF